MVTYNGHNLGDLLFIGDPDFSIANSKADTLEVSGKDGETVRGMRFGPSAVSFSAALTGSAADRRNALSQLAMWLDVDKPKALVLPDTPDRYYLAVPDGPLDIQRAMYADLFTLGFKITDPAAYGQEKQLIMRDVTSMNFTVGGTYPTKPEIQGGVTRDATSKIWGVRLDGGDFIHVPLSSDSGRAVKLNCADRTCTVAGAASLPTLDSDWFEFTPGNHTLLMDNGTGTITVSWRERWL